MLLTRHTINSPIGELAWLAQGEVVFAMGFTQQWPHYDRYLSRYLCVAEIVEGASSGEVFERVEAYFNGDIHSINEIKVQSYGTEFQQQVWGALRKIPAGETRSYGQQAAMIKRPKAVRAVGAANGANPIGLVVPCHRVIGASGSLTGYAGGLNVKQWLLEHEQKQAELF